MTMKPQLTCIKDRPEIQICPIFVDWDKVWNIKFGTDVSIEMLLNATKFQGYSFYQSY